MTQILQEREEISHALQQSLDLATDAWGIKVERVEVKDIVLPATVNIIYKLKSTRTIF